MKHSTAWLLGTAVVLIAAGIVVVPKLATTSRKKKTAVPLAKSGVRLTLPTIKTSGTFFDVIKADGSAWERRATAVNLPAVTFHPEGEVREAKGARSMGASIIALSDGGIVTRQPFTGEWTRIPGKEFDISNLLPEIACQRLIQLIFPDRYLFTGGTFVQKDFPMGAKATTGFRGYFIQHDVVQFGLTDTFLIALLSNGAVLASGNNRFGQRGLVGEVKKNEANRVPIGLAVSISVGEQHAAAALADGTVWMWGNLAQGQLGADNNGGKASAPVQVQGLKNIVQVVIQGSGGPAAMALDRDGHVWFWGKLPGNARSTPAMQIAGVEKLIYIDYDAFGVGLKKDGTAWAFLPTILGKTMTPQKIFDNVRPTETLDIDGANNACPGNLSLGKNQKYARYITEAANKTGIDPCAIAALINAEAGYLNNGEWNPSSKSPTSSALGLTQFEQASWEDMAERPGTALHQVAMEKGFVDACGEGFCVIDEYWPNLLALRTDPHLAIMSAAELGKLNLGFLSKKNLLPHNADATTLAQIMYMAHHDGVGPHGADAILKATLPDSVGMGRLRVNAPQQADAYNTRYGSWALAYIKWLQDYIAKKIRPSIFCH